MRLYLRRPVNAVLHRKGRSRFRIKMSVVKRIAALRKGASHRKMVAVAAKSAATAAAARAALMAAVPAAAVRANQQVLLHGKRGYPSQLL